MRPKGKRGVLAALCVLFISAGLYVLFQGNGRKSVSGPGTARINVLALCNSVAAHQSETGHFLPAGPQPSEVPRGRSVPFLREGAFKTLGFEPGPDVLYQYQVEVVENPVGEPEVRCYARGDLDGDGQHSLFRVTLDANGMTSPITAEQEDE